MGTPRRHTTRARSHVGQPGVVDRDRGYIALRKTLLGLRSQAVRVGIRGEKGGQRPDPKGPTVAEYATMNEFGTAHVPERSAFRAAFDANEEQYVRRFRDGLKLVLDGKDTIERFLGIIGLQVVSDIQSRIEAGPFVPNSPYTIRRKGSSKPLIDTARLKNSIDFELVSKDGES
jgi:hypothetical protein